jgi:hypothetical protein
MPTFLLMLYNEHRLSGRPLVILLHPHLAAAHPLAIKRFIERVKQAGASWTCFRDWMSDASKIAIKRRAAWVNVDAESDTQAAWFDYRGDLIHDLAEEFATAIHEW